MNVKRIVSMAAAAAVFISSAGFSAFAASGVKINKKNFPDEKFRKYVVRHADFNYDGRLSEEEAESMTKMQIIDGSTRSLKGIEYFTELEELLCHGLSLESLDLTGNAKLVRVSCEKNSITNLDISKCTALKYLNCSKNQLTELDLSNNKELRSLDCSENQLDELDVSKNPELVSLYCSFNGFKKLDISKNTKLSSLNCSYNSLTKLDVSKHTKFISLYCNYNQIEKLDLRKNKNLENLDCSNNLLKELDLSNNNKLEFLKCGSNHLTSLDLSKNAAMEWPPKSFERSILFKCDGNEFSINAKVGETYSLSELQKYGFDPKIARNWKGAEYDERTNSIKITEKTVTYLYDCTKGRIVKFTLFPKS